MDMSFLEHCQLLMPPSLSAVLFSACLIDCDNGSLLSDFLHLSVSLMWHIF